MKGERDNNQWKEILTGGINPEEVRDATELIRLLMESGAVITVIQKSNTIKVKITRERDVAEDSDTYIQSQEEPEIKILGFMLPFKHTEEKGFILIDDDFTCSAHFIRESNKDNYDQYDQRLAPGEMLSAIDPARLHTGGVFISFEDIAKRLTPNNLEHVERINELLKVALSQAEERAKTAIEAKEENRKLTVGALANFLRGIKGESGKDTTTPNNIV